MKKVCCQLSPFSHTHVRRDPYTNLVRLKNGNQVATWKTKESGFSFKDKNSKFFLKSQLRSRSTNFKPILIEEVSRNVTGIVDSQRREIDHTIASDEQSRRAQLLLQEQLSEQIGIFVKLISKVFMRWKN